MPTPNEICRLASAISCIRPDWQASSLRTFIERRPELERRPYRDLLVAFAWVAADPATEKPSRIEQHGPWWVAASGGDPPKPAPQPPRWEPEPERVRPEDRERIAREGAALCRQALRDRAA